MADLHIVREHTLGLTKARKIAFQWAEQAETEFGMACAYSEGDTADEVSFSRSGVKGTLEVDASRFELRAQLGFLVGAFKHRIEAEIVKNLDSLLAAPVKKRSSKKAV
ncbi:polyhydroxyalkanoic acid system family protein [Rhodoferax sp. U11-2br]|uniref:polyhydroxyalkanoic acid system family protein n=1 Tax=Rhodoferax sp. U11-2br TaxID=2838878 RepID=UPI001BE5879F|nr:polyhydroxyalkanoic acid system family protein [Rhodoferax sp. U11-2br]MBT3068345.1 polyhydroxyalkanoic acid system family protein [Rhodoferax sp. U11-2br]